MAILKLRLEITFVVRCRLKLRLILKKIVKICNLAITKVIENW
jgi:hypothetical protein